MLKTKRVRKITEKKMLSWPTFSQKNINFFLVHSQLMQKTDIHHTS